MVRGGRWFFLHRPEAIAKCNQASELGLEQNGLGNVDVLFPS